LDTQKKENGTLHLTKIATLLILFIICSLSVLKLNFAGRFLGSVDASPSLLNVSFYGCSYSLGEYTNASVIGKTYGMTQSWYAPEDANYESRIEQAKAANPNYKALIYRNVAYVYYSWTTEWNTCKSNGWLLKDKNGNYVIDSVWAGLYAVDIGSMGYQQWVANVINNWLGNYTFFDGVLADNSMYVLESSWACWFNATPINPRTNNPFTNAEIENASVAIENAIKTAIGNKMLVCNGLNDGACFYTYQSLFLNILNRSSLDGVAAESCWHASWETRWKTVTEWQESVNLTSQFQGYFSNKANGAFVQVCAIDDGIPSGATETQLLLYGYCSALLTTQNDKNYLCTISKGLPDSNVLRLMQTLSSISLGSAERNYMQVSGTQVYMRNFQNVKVLVNPSNSTYKVALNGTIVSSVTLPAHTAEITEALTGRNLTPVHDVATTSIVATETLKTIVGQGYSVRINVTVADLGSYAESFNVTAYANTTAIATQTVTLTSGNSAALTFTWNTKGFTYGSYTISAHAWPVPNETDTADNTFKSLVPMEVTIPGDVDGNHVVNIFDVVKITGIYGLERGNPEFNPNSDIDDNGKITILDVVICASHYAQKWS
jgi:hypothetical protein